MILFLQEQITPIGEVKTYVDIIVSIIGLFGGLFVGLWAYTKFILERGLVPPAEFDICVGNIEKVGNIGSQEYSTIVEIRPLIRNKGSSVLVISPIEIDIRFAYSDLPLEKFYPTTDYTKPYLAGRAIFPESLREYSDSEKLRVVHYDTFISPQVEQYYSFIACLPSDVSLILVKCSFKYRKSPSELMLLIFSLSRFFGLVQFTLDDIRKPHTCERMFSVKQENVMQVEVKNSPLKLKMDEYEIIKLKMGEYEIIKLKYNL